LLQFFDDGCLRGSVSLAFIIRHGTVAAVVHSITGGGDGGFEGERKDRHLVEKSPARFTAPAELLRANAGNRLAHHQIVFDID